MPDDGADRKMTYEIRRTLDEAQPPAGLEDRVLAAARENDLVSTPRRGWVSSISWWPVAAAAVLALAAFALGYLVASGPTGPPAQTGDLYVLLLRESETSAPTDPEENQRLVKEYSAWAREKAGEGVLVGGEKLDVDGVVLDASGDGVDRRSWSREPGFLGGYFLIRAGSYEEAVEISRTCPHLKHGGDIEIRRIE